MTLKTFDGFDHYNSTADFMARTGWLQWTQAGLTGVEFTTGRDGIGRAIRGPANSGSFTGTFADRIATRIIGFAKWISYHTDSGSSPFVSVSLVDSVAQQTQMIIQFNAENCTISVFRGDGTLLLLTNNNVWTLETWEFVEIKCTVDDAVGSLVMRLKGQEIINLSGIDTKRSTNAWWDQVQFGFGAESTIYDDFYVCDTVAGPGTYPCDDFLGDMKCYTVFPIGTDQAQWTPLANTNWQEVDEVSMDSDASYNYSKTAGQEDRFVFAALENTINHIVGVQITGAYRKDDAGVHTLKQALKSNVTESYGTTYSIPDSYTYLTDLFVLDPDTGISWTLDGVNAISAGYNLVS